jgi:tetratricopeptide (TPR) repeat protein
MDSKMIAIGGVTAGLLFAGWGVLLRDETTYLPEQPNAIESLVSEQPANGLRSTDEIVEFWSARVAASPSGYLDRTQLGVALAGRARENADLAEYEASEQVLRTALEINPGYDPAKLALAQALHSQHRFAEAVTLATGVRRADPNSLGALALLGDANFELGEYATAAALYHELAGLERSAPVVSRLSRLAFAEGDPIGSLTLAQEAADMAERLELRPSELAFYSFQLGHVRFATGDVDGATEALEHAIDLAPGHPGATEQLAFVYASAGRNAEAEDLYRALIESGPAADLHGSYADLLRARGATDLAEEQERLGRELALETIDRFPAERRHLAGFFMTRDSAIAVRLAEHDLAERRDLAAYDTLAWALYHDGQHAAAADAIASALATGVRDASVLYHAAAIAAANDDVPAARALLDDALSISARFHPTEARDAESLRERLG